MRVVLVLALLVSSVVAPAFGADRAIQNGIDVWRTTGDGTTYVDFAKNPIPAGFFCSTSAPFTDRVPFKGAPIVTGTPGALGKADTIVQRLDDAVFDERGVATTRIQFRALSLRSIAPIDTSCGKFDLSVSLDGAQPTTQMRIIRDNDKGGHFFAPLALNVKVQFTPVGWKGETLEIALPVRFTAAPSIPWKTTTAAQAGFVLVDTDGDRTPDTYLPGMSNFIAGAERPAPRRPGSVTTQLGEFGQFCHFEDDCSHCFYCPTNGCSTP